MSTVKVRLILAVAHILPRHSKASAKLLGKALVPPDSIGCLPRECQNTSLRNRSLNSAALDLFKVV